MLARARRRSSGTKHLKKKEKAKSRWLSAARDLALGLAVLLPVLVWIGKEQAEQPLSVTEIKIVAAELGSLSSESKLLAEETLASQVSASYFEVHSRMLLDEGGKAEKKLSSSAPDSALEDSHRRATTLAHRVTITSRDLSISLHDPAALEAAAQKFAVLGKAARALEQTLEQAQDANAPRE